MDTQKKTDGSSLGLSVEDLLMGVLSLEQGESKRACNLIMQGLRKLDAQNKTTGNPSELVEGFRKMKAKIERVNKMKAQNFVLTSDGRIDMDRNSEFKVAEFIATAVAGKLGRPAEDLASCGYCSDKEIKLGSGVGVAFMNTWTGAVRLHEPLRIEVGWFDPAEVSTWSTSPFMARVGEFFPGSYYHDFGDKIRFHIILSHYRTEDVGEYVKGTGKFIRFQWTVQTGSEDLRSYEQRKADLMSGWTGDQRIAKSRAGFGLGQNYINGNFFNPSARCVVANDAPIDVVNQRFYESWLGDVGQLDRYPYHGHALAPVAILEKLADCHTAEQVAEVVRQHWQELFTADEVGSIYAGLRL